MAMTLPRVVVFAELLSADECAELIALARSRLARSETVETATGASAVNPARTSDGMFFEPGEFPGVRAPREAHRDAARLAARERRGPADPALRAGHRVPAALRLLRSRAKPARRRSSSAAASVSARSSATSTRRTPAARPCSPTSACEVAPVRGNGVFFSYDRPHPATRTLHGGAPVTAGEKWVATRWLREAKFE
jgi:prolyl 4-hydroxylase